MVQDDDWMVASHDSLMATHTTNIPAAAPPEIKIKTRRIVTIRLGQAARRSLLPLEIYCAQILEAHSADLNLKEICADSPVHPKTEVALEQTNQNHRLKIRPADVQKILFLSGEMSIPELARRFRVDRSSVRRILKRHDAAQHTPSAIRGTGQRGWKSRTFRAT